MRRHSPGSKLRVGRPGGYRKLAGPEQVEPRLLLDGALPQVMADAFTVHTNDDPATLNVLANDSFAGYAGPGRITALSFPTHGGTADISSDGRHVVFRPAADFSGTDTFSYVVDDQFSAEVDVQVVSPLASDTATVFPDGHPQTINVLANDPFWSGYSGARQITWVSAAPLGGTVSIGPDGKSVIYSAPSDLADLGSTDHFSYIVDGKYTADVAVLLFNPLTSSTQEVPQNSDPVSLAPATHFDQWSGYTGAKLITKVSDATTGNTATISADGRSIVFQPATGFLGPDTINYVVDGKFTASITVYVGTVVYSDNFNVDANDPGTMLDVLQNDIYYHQYSTGYSSRLASQITAVTQPDHGGHVSIANDGTQVLYTPAANFAGAETFTYQANGKYTTSVSVAVSQPGRDDYFPGGGTKIVADSRDNVLDVLPNDFYRASSTPHAITLVGTPTAGGTVTISADGQRLSYTPRPGFIGHEEFFYTVDGKYTATVHIDIASPAADITQQLDPNQEQSYRVPLSPGLRGISGYSGQGLVTAVSVTSGNATVSVSADGTAAVITGGDYQPVTISYTIDGKYTANLSVTFRWSQYLSTSNTVVDQNLASKINVLASFIDTSTGYGYLFLPPYQGPRLITAAFGAQHGTVSVAPDGKTVIYRSNDDFAGPDTFEYLVDGHELGSATVQVIRRVRDDQYRVNASSQGNVLPAELNDQLGGGYTGIGRITAVGTAGHGSVQISADGHSLVYTPVSGYSGTDTVSYTVDGHLKATVTITVAATADSSYPRFGSLDALENWLLDNATRQYASLFGTTPGYPIYTLTDQIWTNASDIVRGNTTFATDGHSDTNVQVDGVDEADLTEADSNYLYVLSGGKLVITAAQSATPLTLLSQTAYDGTAVGMYLSGDRLTVVSQMNNLPVILPFNARLMPTAWGSGQTIVTVFDVSDRSHPSLVQKTVFDGTNVDSRQIGNLVYLVLNHNSNALSLSEPQYITDPASANNPSGSPSTERYETKDEYVARVRANFGQLLDGMLPHFRSFGPDGSLIRSGLIVTPDELVIPSDPSDTALLSIVTIDTGSAEPGIVAALGVSAAPGATVYMTHDSLYLLNSVSGGEGQQTGIWKFTLDETTGIVTPAAYGQVPGRINDQFSVDDSQGDLRIATTVSNAGGDNWSYAAENDVWVVSQDGNQLELIGALQNLAHGESIRSVRFSGDQVVITTFPTTGVGFDPVYCIDLSNPNLPRFVGELTLPGFNQYMQFIDATHVLTVGMNAPSSGSQAFLSGSLPLQVSLFDVADFSHPHLLDQYTLPRFSTSTAQNDHHAFGWFPELGILALPISRSYTQQQDLDGDGYRETTTWVHADEIQYFHIQTSLTGGSGRGVQPVGTIDLTSAALRGAFIGNTLYAIGDGQIVASRVDAPGTPTGSILWTVPPNVVFPPILRPPLIVTPITVRPVGDWNNLVSAIPAAPVASPRTSGTPDGTQPTIDTWVQAARTDLATLLHVAPESALLVSVEAPEPAAGGAAAPFGFKFVLEAGNHDLLYQEASDGSVRLVDADFHFASDTAVSATVAPSFDVNRDGYVSPVDLLRIVDSLAHDSTHRVRDAVLRQLATDNTQGAFDVNHDGMVSPLDLLLEINAVSSPQPVVGLAAQVAAPQAAVATLSATVASSVAAPLAAPGPQATSLAFVTDAIFSASGGPAVTQLAATTTPLGTVAYAMPPLAATSPSQPERHDAVLALSDPWSLAGELSLGGDEAAND